MCLSVHPINMQHCNLMHSVLWCYIIKIWKNWPTFKLFGLSILTYLPVCTRNYTAHPHISKLFFFLFSPPNHHHLQILTHSVQVTWWSCCWCTWPALHPENTPPQDYFYIITCHYDQKHLKSTTSAIFRPSGTQMESLSFHNTSRTLLSVTAEHLKKTPLAFSIALQPLKCLHGQYGKVHTEIALLSCFPSCHRCVLQALVWVSHRLHQVFSVLCCCGSEVQRSISGGGWEEEGVWSGSSTQ